MLALTFATRKSAKIPLPPNSSRPRETTYLAFLDVHACIQLLSVVCACKILIVLKKCETHKKEIIGSYII
jgi:hypothetical protein